MSQAGTETQAKMDPAGVCPISTPLSPPGVVVGEASNQNVYITKMLMVMPVATEEMVFSQSARHASLSVLYEKRREGLQDSMQM